MTFQELTAKVSGTVVVDNPNATINNAYSGDLLSDVMGHCGDESVLITIQNHLNAIAVCTLAGIEAVVICQGRPVPDDMKAAAEREGVGILTPPPFTIRRGRRPRRTEAVVPIVPAAGASSGDTAHRSRSAWTAPSQAGNRPQHRV